MSILAVMGIATNVTSLFPIQERELSCDYNPIEGILQDWTALQAVPLAPTLSTSERG
jgi:hypothetical protein